MFVYLGSANGLKPDSVQKITALDLPHSVGVNSTFGYSLSGALDLDKNGYPDLLVGAYDSDSVSFVILLCLAEFIWLILTDTHYQCLCSVRLFCSEAVQ